MSEDDELQFSSESDGSSDNYVPSSDSESLDDDNNNTQCSNSEDEDDIRIPTNNIPSTPNLICQATHLTFQICHRQRYLALLI